MKFYTATVILQAVVRTAQACPYLGYTVGEGEQNPHERTADHQEETEGESSNIMNPVARGLQRVRRPTLFSMQMMMMTRMGGTETKEERRARIRTPPPPPSPPSFQGTVAEAIDAATADIANLVSAEPFLGPSLVRLAFHDCVGGCNGCVDMSKKDNFGLDFPMDKLTPLVRRYANQLSRADVWALAAIKAAQVMQKDESIPFEFNYVGRTSCPDERGGIEPPMPSPNLTNGGILRFFENEFGFTEQETVAIMGAHTL